MFKQKLKSLDYMFWDKVNANGKLSIKIIKIYLC